MDFNHFLTSYMPDPNIGSKQHFKHMLDQSVLAEKLGYVAVSIPEHHLVNLLMMPSPLQMAVKISSLTNKIRLSTSVAVLPIHDMRTFAGEVATADILTEGRLVLGVARGAFAWELDRLGTPIESSKEKFIESLEVLNSLLSKENYSFKGKYYNFNAITIMPRPISDPIPIMIAAMDPSSIRNAASNGYHVQSTVLSGTKKLLLERVNAFKEGQQDAGENGKLLRLSMQRMAYAAKDENDAKEKNLLAYEYYKRFDNMYTGPGKVNKGLIEPLPRAQTLEEMTENLIICPVNEMIDKLSVYAGSGIDEMIISAGFGQSQEDMIESMYRISEHIIPHFKVQKSQVA
jgi:alkanesulfonate monooxygenase SsuD/methylene tetrahydromethanopterin reductase-like flavin-dependent oxidoreductase (luciferase family)|tara:strand:+ start:1276 stop:2310 length:1035 start_codon:yes stop_codon:yes gene_type:complete